MKYTGRRIFLDRLHHNSCHASAGQVELGCVINGMNEEIL